jgi:hypothetical protein
LIHSGLHTQTNTIRADIVNTLPFAEALRWDIHSQAGFVDYRKALLYAPIVPANLIELSSDRAVGWSDPWNGLDDIATENYRFIRNGFYSQSPLREAGRDIELFGTLLFYKTMLRGTTKSYPESTANPAAAVIEDGCYGQDWYLRLSSNKYLQTKLLYFLSAIKASRPKDLVPISGLTAALKLDSLVDYIRSIPSLGSTCGTLLEWPELRDTWLSHHFWNLVNFGYLSFRLANGNLMTGRWSTLIEPMSDLADRFVAGVGKDLIRGQKIIAASPAIPCGRGQTLSSANGQAPHLSASSFGDELIHLCVPLDLGSRYPEDISVIISIAIGSRTIGVLSPPTACESLNPQSGCLYLRANVGGILNEVCDGFQPVSIRAFIVRLQQVFAGNLEPLQ